MEKDGAKFNFHRRERSMITRRQYNQLELQVTVARDDTRGRRLKERYECASITDVTVLNPPSVIIRNKREREREREIIIVQSNLIVSRNERRRESVLRKSVKNKSCQKRTINFNNTS